MPVVPLPVILLQEGWLVHKGNTLIENSYTTGTLTGTGASISFIGYIGGLVGAYSNGSSMIRYSYRR